MPEQVPSSVARSFEAVIPAAIIIIVIGTINVVFKVNIEQVIQTLFSPLVKAGDTFLGVLVPVFLGYFFSGFLGFMVTRSLAQWHVRFGFNFLLRMPKKLQTIKPLPILLQKHSFNGSFGLEDLARQLA